MYVFKSIYGDKIKMIVPFLTVIYVSLEGLKKYTKTKIKPKNEEEKKNKKNKKRKRIFVCCLNV